MIKFIKDIKFIKSDGSIEDYDEGKMIRFLNRLGMDKPEKLLNDFCEEVNGMMRTSDVISTLEKVAARRISPAHPQYEDYAAALYFAARLNRDWRNGYPKIEVLRHSRRINQEQLKTFEPYFDKINAYIKPERDRLFTYKAASLFYDKYCHHLSEIDKKEMPQITYMRTAMFLEWKPDFTEDDLQAVFEQYDDLSLHEYTYATPVVTNSLSIRPQTSSCSLMEVDDCTVSITDTAAKISVMSANLAGTACNVSRLRASGSTIANGITSGPIAFLKVFESCITAWNQGGVRPGALNVYFQWWHPDVMDLLSLKSNGGTDDNRARRLKYGFKLNEEFLDRVMRDEMVALVSPHEAPDLLDVFGDEFNKRYEKYLNDPKTKKVRARTIWVKFCKERGETGNIYPFHEENVNLVGMIGRYVGSSNLCTEVMLPTAPNKGYRWTVNKK